MPAAALLSFLKQARGLEQWTEKDLAAALKISASQAKQAMAVLEMQGYVEPAGHTAKWKVTEQGILVSGAKPPRLTRKSVEEALAGVRKRIQATNEDKNAAYRVAEAVAY
jgi:DNA-binding IclR family transcriptional regulator